MKKLFIILSFVVFIFPPLVSARTSQADIMNAQKTEYNSKLNTYSPQSKQKIENYDQKIAELNKFITDDWEATMVRQGEILEEYIRRNKLDDTGSKDGINRNLSDSLENAKYWLTYAHEAVAYQAAKVYLINLSGEKNINSDILSEINALQADLNGLEPKVLKSQQIISKLIQ